MTTRFFKEILVALFLIVVAEGSIAQPKSFDNLNGGYYLYINKAELAVVDSAFSLADSLYELAFKRAINSFGQDYFLAAKNALLLNKFELCKSYLELAIRNGVTDNQILDDHQVGKYVDKENFLKSVDFKSLSQEYKKISHDKLSKRIHRMVKWDQLVRTIPGFYGLFAYNMDRNHFKKLQEFFLVYGSSTNQIFKSKGVKNKNDIDGVALLLRHFELYEIEVLTPFLLLSIDSGFFNPRLLASAIDYKVMINPGVTNVTADSVTFLYTNKYGVLNPILLGMEFSEGNPQVLDSIRGLIGIEPIEDQLKKQGKKIEEFYGQAPNSLVVISRSQLGKMWRKEW